MSPGKTRATLLSPRTARIEFSKTGIFPEGPSFFFMHRKESIPWPDRKKKGAKQTYASEHFEIHVIKDGKSPSPENLIIRWKLGGRSGEWRPGDIDDQNLGASFSALDNCSNYFLADGVHPLDPMEGQDKYRCSTNDVHRFLEKALREHLGAHPDPKLRNKELKLLAQGKSSKSMPDFPVEVQKALEKVRRFPPGFLSRSGLSLIRDTGPLWDTERQWFRPRPDGHFDLTAIACGDDFKGTLGEISRLAGPIPLLPLWALGVWFSCYRKMGEKELRELARDFEKHDLPLDVLVVDTDWHKHNWNGFDWNLDLFPDPEGFFKWLRKEKLHTTFNVHPGFVPGEDSRLEEFREKSGNKKPLLTEETAPHPFFAGCLEVDLMDPLEAKAWFDVFHLPITRMGCDLWWVDGATAHWDGDEGTAWLNHLYHRHMRDAGSESPLVFSRASGLGCHRTTLAFSGDAWVQWEVLAQEVESTIRGACVLMALWSHDIGGFWNPVKKGENKPPDDLFVRWTQFGALSPVMRYHSDHGVREPWLFEKETLELCREALNLRMRLVPHLYDLVRDAHETGVAPWRPMCFEYPREEEAYRRWRQVMIGEGLLFAPVIDPKGKIEVWFPPGEWTHLQSGEIIEGPRIKRWKADLAEIPLFLRQGHTLKLAPPVRRTSDLK